MTDMVKWADDWGKKASERTLIGNTPSCDLCGEQHGESDCEEIPSMPWCEHCQSYHHTTAEHIKKAVETIDLTPVGCQTPEGNARVLQAQQEWDSATHLLANTVKQFFDAFEDPIRGLFLVDASLCEELHQLRALIGARDRKQEAFLRAVIGQPERPPRPKLKTYPATVNGKTVQVTIPED